MLSNSTARMPRLIASAMRNTSLFPMVAFGASPSDDVAVSWGIFFSSTAAMRSNAALIFRAVSAASDLVIGVARSRCDTTRRDIRGSKERYGDAQSFAYEMQTLHAFAKLKICMHLLRFLEAVGLPGRRWWKRCRSERCFDGMWVGRSDMNAISAARLWVL